MNNLNKKALGGLAQLVLAMALLLFLPAWIIYYWQAWLYLFLFAGSTAAITFYLMKKDPALLLRRMNAGPSGEKEKSQKIIQGFASIAFIMLYILSALDYRFGWSEVPVYAAVSGDVLVVVGLYIVFLVFRENSFTSATVEVDKDQKVISTGPYALVRHPMYCGAFIMLIGTAPALGSLWGLLPVLLVCLVIVWRLMDEEKFLSKNLPGYDDYRKRVRSRLIPGIF